MPWSSIFLVVASFLASSVEMVEALTIVLAVGVSRGWRSTLNGVVLALIALALFIAALGPALTLVPIGTLRLIVGTILLIFGLQWLRKAILRSSGYKALHDEELIFERNLRESRQATSVVRAGMDWYSFTLAFKGVFLEGLEVAFIVVTFGSTSGRPGDIQLAALGAVIAVVLVGIAGVAVHRPLSQVPENTMKFAVGLMLSTFGIFFAGEGVNVQWPGEDAAILAILTVLALWSFFLVGALRRTKEQSLVGAKG